MMILGTTWNEVAHRIAGGAEYASSPRNMGEHMKRE